MNSVLLVVCVILSGCLVTASWKWVGAVRLADKLAAANLRHQAYIRASETRYEELMVKYKTEQSEREYYEKLARTFEKEVLAITAGRG